MKKIISLVLMISMLSLAGCSLNKNNNHVEENPDNIQEITDTKNEAIDNNEEIVDNKEKEKKANSNEEKIKKQLISTPNWPAKNVYDNKGEEIALNIYYGSGIAYSNEGFVFNQDNTFSCFVGIWGESDADYIGTYSIDEKNKEITFKYDSGLVSVAKYRLDESNNIIDFTEEKVSYSGETVRILFIPYVNDNKITQNSDFDFKILKYENSKQNKIYSPLSIKYGMKMLEEACNGETKNQILNLIGDFTPTKYESNNNISIANALFIRDSFKDNIKSQYMNTLKKYDAEICLDSFEKAEKINNWVNEKTFKLIPTIISDEDVSLLDYALINALVIDMEWENKFIHPNSFEPVAEYYHEANIDVYRTSELFNGIFNNGSNELEVSVMDVNATINNYDIIKELGEENIKEIVEKEFRKVAKDYECYTEEETQEFLNSFMPNYLKEISTNYHKSGYSTDFSLYVDEDVKVFAKDLKTYNDTTLQYIGIMPTTKDLDEFITNIDSTKIDNYISTLKTIDYQNFEEGVATKISGYIPKFKFEYNLELHDFLESNNVKNIFDSTKADLSNMLVDSEGASISKILHKTNIEFTQDGIKAAAAFFVGGGGAGEPFNYYFDVPTKEIDITFDKPFMFIIRNKDTNEIWFTGTVYEPLLWENEENKQSTI